MLVLQHQSCGGGRVRGIDFGQFVLQVHEKRVGLQRLLGFGGDLLVLVVLLEGPNDFRRALGVGVADGERDQVLERVDQGDDRLDGEPGGEAADAQAGGERRRVGDDVRHLIGPERVEQGERSAPVDFEERPQPLGGRPRHAPLELRERV